MGGEAGSHRLQARLAALALGAVLVVAPPNPPAHAFLGALFAGISDLIQGVFALPVHILAGTMSGPPIIGTVGGVLTGAMQTVTSTTRGVFRLLTVAIPIAAKAAPYLPFVL